MNSRPLARAAAFILVILFCAGRAQAVARAECRSLKSHILARQVNYCLLLPPSYDLETQRRYPVLYFLHGLGDNEQMFLRSGGLNLVTDLWEQKRIGEFLVVTPGAGASFYINSRDARQRYEDFFIQEFIPHIERAYRIRASRASRAISGASMGGYGALHLAFRHPELFIAVSAHSPALIEKLPAVSASKDTPGPRSIFGGAFGSPFDAAFWYRQSPLTQARTAVVNGMKIYFDCGTEDDFGFGPGAEALHRILGARRIPHEFHLYPGGHNWTYFATHIPESLQFHSRTFGLSAK